MSKNRFAGLGAVNKIQQDKKDQDSKNVKTSKPKITQKKISIEAEKKSNGSNIISTPKRGRPKGKRSNSNFQQVTAYVRRDTYRKVSIELLDRENKGEFSELVEDLLQKWLKEKSKSN